MVLFRDDIVAILEWFFFLSGLNQWLFQLIIKILINFFQIFIQFFLLQRRKWWFENFNIFLLNLINLWFLDFYLFSLRSNTHSWESDVLFDVRSQNLFCFLENLLLLQSFWQSFLENKHIHNRNNQDNHHWACSSLSWPFFILNVRLFFWMLYMNFFWLCFFPQFWSKHSVCLFSWYQRFSGIEWTWLLNLLVNLYFDLWEIRIHTILNIIDFFHELFDFLIEIIVHLLRIFKS